MLSLASRQHLTKNTLPSSRRHPGNELPRHKDLTDDIAWRTPIHSQSCSCRYLLQLSAPATHMDSAAADILPVLDALLEIPQEVRQALTNSSPPMPASTGEDSQAGVSSNQGPVFRAAEISGNSGACAAAVDSHADISMDQEPFDRAAHTSDNSRASSQAATGGLQDSPASAACSPPVAGSRAAHAAGPSASTSGRSDTPSSSRSAGSRASAWQDGSSQEHSGAAAATEPGTVSGLDPALQVSTRPDDAGDGSHNAGETGVSSSADAAALVPDVKGNSSHFRADSLSTPAPHGTGIPSASLDRDLHAAHDNIQAAANPPADAGSALPAADHTLQGGSSLDKSSTSISDDVPAAAQEPAAPTSGSASAAVGSSGTGRLQSKRPAILFAACWTQHTPHRAQYELPENVAMCSPPDAQITFDAALLEVDGLIDRLYGSGAAASWDSKRGLQDDESDEEAVEALSHALEQTAAID